MTKRLKFGEAGDSDELQALFDSMAAEPAASGPRAESRSTDNGPAAVADSDELQALFDSVAAEISESAVAREPQAPAATASGDSDELQALFDEVAGRNTQPVQAAERREDAGADGVFTRLGQMTRKLHDTLRELGYDSALQQAAQAIPDARERLSYIAHMTEQSAARVLNATDIARPLQESIETAADALALRWNRLYANELSVEEFKALSADTRAFLGQARDGARTTNAQLLEIMMAQDFQDLTGQVIKRVVELAQTLESQLLQVLIEAAPAEVRPDRHSGLMNGPVVNAAGRDDIVTSQEQVDDLLESLGF